jgi:hypothetical protein
MDYKMNPFSVVLEKRGSRIPTDGSPAGTLSSQCTLKLQLSEK